MRPTPAAACNQWALHGYATMAALRLVDSTRAARLNALTHGRPSRPGSEGYSAEELLIAFSLAERAIIAKVHAAAAAAARRLGIIFTPTVLVQPQLLPL